MSDLARREVLRGEVVGSGSGFRPTGVERAAGRAINRVDAGTDVAIAKERAASRLEIEQVRSRVALAVEKADGVMYAEEVVMGRLVGSYAKEVEAVTRYPGLEADLWRVRQEGVNLCSRVLQHLGQGW